MRIRRVPSPVAAAVALVRSEIPSPAWEGLLHTPPSRFRSRTDAKTKAVPQFRLLRIAETRLTEEPP